MKFFPMLLISVVTIALGWLAVMQQLRGNLDFLLGAPPVDIGKTLYQFDPTEVGRIQILNHDGTRGEIVKTKNGWLLREPWEDHADARIIRSLIDFAARLQVEDVIDRDEVDDPAGYGLKKDRIEVQLFDTAGSPLCHFRLGRYTSWRGFDPQLEDKNPTQKPPSFPTLIVQPVEDELEDHLYVCPDFANPVLRTVPIRELFREGLRLFRDHRLFSNSPGSAAQITLTEKNSEITLKRENLAKDTEWTIDKPYQLATSSKAIEQLIKGLTTLEAVSVLNKGAIALPPPLPDNLDLSITIRHFQTDGSIGEPVTARFFPPENDKANVVPVTISEGPEDTRSAVLLVPRGPGSLLATLPRSVNSLRSRTLTAMNVRQIEGVSLRDFTGRSVNLSLKMVPHERASRWFARVLREDAPGEVTENYDGPANSKQVFDFFGTLFKNEVVSFTDDASTSPEDYGLDRPIRTIVIRPKEGEARQFVIGVKLLPKYYARRAPNGRVIEISEEAYQAGISGQDHRELSLVAQPTTDSDRPPGDLGVFGLDRPQTIIVDKTSLHLGKASSQAFYGNQLDENGKHTPHVVQIAPDQVSKMPLAAYHWRGERLWNINRFEVNGLIIRKRGEVPLELAYDFYDPSPWTATRGAEDVTALLNTNKAEKLLKKLTDIEVQRWIGPVAESAASNLSDPSLSISVLIEKMSDDGSALGKIRNELRLAEVVRGPANRFYFGKSDTEQSYFLLDDATHQRLSVDLLEE